MKSGASAQQISGVDINPSTANVRQAASQRAGRWYLHLKHAARPHTCDDANFCFTSLALDITGCSVKADARGMDIGITTVGPIDEARHRVQQGLA